MAKEGEDYGYNDFVEGIDTVIMGRRTYEWVLNYVEQPHAGKKLYVITTKAQPDKGHITFYNGPVNKLIEKLKKEPGQNIFCDGGSVLAHHLLQHGLIDEFIISIIPVLLGEGIKLFKDGRPETGLQLISAKSFDTGLVQLHYRRD